MDLVGRHAERAALEQLLGAARAGRSGAVVVRGEAGIGKSALLEHARETAIASGFRVEHSVGTEAETHFAFSGVHQLCAPLLDRAGALPQPQQAALGVAFGLRSGTAPDRFLVGLAVLNLLAEVAEEQPLLCLVDDAQWLDEASAQVLAFAARRLGAERMGLVFAVRDPADVDLRPFGGLPELRVDGLGDGDARTLLATGVRVRLDDAVRDRIVAEARGNPLALLELPRGAAAAQLAGGFVRPDLVSVPRRVEEFYGRRSGSLPPDAQLVLLLAAAEPTGDVALLRRAAAHLGIALEAAAPAETAGLVELDARVRFRHPLVRSAVYRAAAPPDLRRAHDALAAATDPRVDRDRWAWHRAQAVVGADEQAAAELEVSAVRARARGGLAASAAFLQRAAELTPAPAVRARRTLEAAAAEHDAGASEAALQLLAVASAGPLDVLQRARLQLLRAQIAFHLARGPDVPGMLLEAARTLAPLDPALSRETYLRAFDAAFVLGGPDQRRGALEVAHAASAAPPAPGQPGPVDLLLDALVTTFLQGYAAAVPGLRRALEAFRRDEPHLRPRGDADGRRWLWLASRTAATLSDDELAHELASRHVELAREAGAVASLPSALVFLSAFMVLSGQFSRATELAAEANAIVLATGAAPLGYADLALAAWRGREADATELQAASDRAAAAGGGGPAVAFAQYALSVLHNSLGDSEAALDAAVRACEGELLESTSALSELVEAAVRAGRPDRAARALDELRARARASGTPWALGLAARAQALTSTGPDAEEHYRAAVEHLGRCRIVPHLARAHLVHGEWLRREGRRQDAREQLRTAHDLLSGMGAEAFAARAARELRAAGESPRSRSARPTDALTAQELQIARLVASGATSREVGAQLFLSPRTIEAHLRSIFRKLAITSRRQLRHVPLP